MLLKRDHLHGLSWLRIGLALYLIYFHTIRNYKDLPDWVIPSSSAGFLSTSLFFIISGFILTYVYYDQNGNLKKSKLNFLSARFFTLYPLHIIGFILSSIIMLGQYVTTGYVMAIADTPIHLDLTKAIATVPVFLHAPEIAFNAISHLLLLHAWNPFYLTFNTPSWSISALIFFYLCFVYIGKYISQIKYPLLGLITLNLIYLIPPLIFIINDNYGAIATGLLHTNPLFRLPEFLSGVMLCFWLQKANYFEFKKIKFFTITISLLSILIVSVYLLLINGPAGFYLAHNGFLLPLELAIVVIFAKMPPLNGAWLNRLVDRLGNATLSIFILHMPLFYFFSHLEELIKVYLKDSSLNQLSKQMKEVEPSIALYPLIILIIVVISVVVQERFVLKIRPSLQKKCKPIISRWLSVVQNLPMGRGGK